MDSERQISHVFAYAESREVDKILQKLPLNMSSSVNRCRKNDMKVEGEFEKSTGTAG
jgi:hypothetical protein